MMVEAQRTDLLTQLRDDFDRSFVLPTQTATDELVEFLGFRIGDTGYAVQLGNVGTVHEIRSVTRVPCRFLGFEGLVAVQNQLVAVYDLAVLAAAPGKSTSRRWLLVCRDDRQVGFAVDAVDAYLRVPLSRVIATADSQQCNTAVRQAIDHSAMVRLVVDFPTLLTSLRRDIDREGRSTR